MAEQEIKKFTQRLPAYLHEFARNEAYQKKMSLNDYIISLIKSDWVIKQATEGLENQYPNEDFLSEIDSPVAELDSENARDFVNALVAVFKKKTEELAEEAFEKNSEKQFEIFVDRVVQRLKEERKK